MLWRNLAQDIEHDMRMDAYRHVQELELAYFEDRSSGGLMAVLNDDVNQLERFLDVGANEMILTISNVVLVGLAFFVISPELAFLAFLPIPVIVDRVAAATSARSSRGTTPCGPRPGASPTRSPTTSAASPPSRPSPPRSARSSGSPSTAAPTARPTREAIRLSSAFIPLIRMAILAGFTDDAAGRRPRRARTATSRSASTPSLVYMTQRLLWPLTELGETLDLYQRAMASCRRIFGLLDGASPAIQPGTRELRDAGAGARCASTTCRFALRHRSPTCCTASTSRSPAGETHAIVGATGAGKSTVVKLLLRLYEPTAGPDHASTACRSTSSPSARCAARSGFVSQDVFLFQGTVRENLTYGRPDATDDGRGAGRHAWPRPTTFISALPDGYDTIVGERGQKLSGGQRQRLTIARAILRDPAILVLDEATSAVDNETEAAIQRSLARVSADRTTIVIAHRLSTVRHAHRIHVLEAGRGHRGRHPRGARRARRPLRRPVAGPDRRSHRRRPPPIVD